MIYATIVPEREFRALWYLVIYVCIPLVIQLVSDFYKMDLFYSSLSVSFYFWGNHLGWVQSFISVKTIMILMELNSMS